MEEIQPTPVADSSCQTRPVLPGDFEQPSTRAAARQAEDIHICPSCSSSFVIPVDWAPSTGGRWVVHLRCPECEWAGGGTYSQSVVDRYDKTLDSATEAILEDLTVLSRANMEEHVEAFAAALWSDRILPEDF